MHHRSHIRKNRQPSFGVVVGRVEDVGTFIRGQTAPAGEGGGGKKITEALCFFFGGGL